MQHAVYLAVALAVAAAILSMAVAMKTVLPPPEAPLEHAEALVYVKVKPLNGSYWLGVHAPYGDVVVKQVRVNNTAYELGVTAPVGKDTWLNASGRPLTVRCNSTVELVTAKGGAARSLAFTVQCPRLERRTEVKTMLVLDSWKEFALSAFQWLSTADVPKLAATIDPTTREVVIKNVADIPLFIVADLQSGTYPPDVAFARLWGSFLGQKFAVLKPGEEVRVPLSQLGNLVDMGIAPIRVPVYIVVTNATPSYIAGYINGVPFNYTAYTFSVCSSTYTYKGAVVYGSRDSRGNYYPLLALIYEGGKWYAFTLNDTSIESRGTAICGPDGPLLVKVPLDAGRLIIINYTAPFEGPNYRATHKLYVYPAFMVSDTAFAGASPLRGYYVEAVPLNNDTYVVQWISQADDSANRSALLRPGESVFIPFNLTATLPPIFDVAPGVQIAVSQQGWKDCVWQAPSGARYYTSVISVGVSYGLNPHIAAWNYRYLTPQTVMPIGYSTELCVHQQGAKLTILLGGVWNQTIDRYGNPRWEYVNWRHNLTLYVESVTAAWLGSFPARAVVGVYFDGKRVGQLVYRNIGWFTMSLDSSTLPRGRYGVWAVNEGGLITLTRSPATDYGFEAYGSQLIPMTPTTLSSVPYNPPLWLPTRTLPPNNPYYTPNFPTATAGRQAVLAAVKAMTGMAQVYDLKLDFYHYNYCPSPGAKAVGGGYSFVGLYLDGKLTSFGLIQVPRHELWYTCSEEGGSAPDDGDQYLNYCPESRKRSCQVQLQLPERVDGGFRSAVVGECKIVVTDCRGNTYRYTDCNTLKTFFSDTGFFGISDKYGKICGMNGVQSRLRSDDGTCSNIAVCATG